MRNLGPILYLGYHTCCVTLGKILTLSGSQFPLLHKQTRACSCPVLVCQQNPQGAVFKAQVPGSHPQRFAWESVFLTPPVHQPQAF